MKPYSEACDQNRDPILNAIQPLLADCQHVLEIGSGTGQHAVYFAEKMPHLIWQTSDRMEYHKGIHMWLDEAKLPNTRPPLTLDVSQTQWPEVNVDAIFSANTAHIMHWQDVEALFKGVADRLPSQGLFLLYGPFNYHGNYTSPSNERFDAWLKQRDPESGVRDFDDLNQLATQGGLSLVDDYAMPANNRILFWRKR